jgi:hypothetical protein
VHDLRRERLEARIKEADVYLNSVRGMRLEERDKRLYHAAEDALNRAKAAQEKDRMQVAWAHSHQAYRFILEGMEGPELEARATMIRHEATEKLKNWRGEAARRLLAKKKLDGGKKRPANGVEVALAQMMLDQFFDNVYFKLEIIGSQMRRVLWILGALTVLVLTLSPLIGAFQWIAVTMLFGAVGAALSRALTAGFGDSRIPQVLGNPETPFLRLSVGALSAVVVLCVVRSEILPIEPPAGYGSYVWAVAAGFSDQLLNRMMIAVANSAEK